MAKLTFTSNIPKDGKELQQQQQQQQQQLKLRFCNLIFNQ